MAESKDPSPKGKGHADMEEFGSLAVYNVNPKTVNPKGKGKMTEEPEIMVSGSGMISTPKVKGEVENIEFSARLLKITDVKPYARVKGGAESEASRSYGTKVAGGLPLTRADKRRMKAGMREFKKLRMPEKNVTFYAGDDENDDGLF